MAMPVNRVQLMNELRVKIEKDPEVARKSKEFAEEVRDYWRHIAPREGDARHPYATGAYRDSIQRFSERGRGARGWFMYRHWVGTYDPIAHLLEYGTVADAPGGHATWIGLDGKRYFGPNTPTPAFGFAARVAAHFGGTAP